MEEEVILDHSLYYNGVVSEHFAGLIIFYITMFFYSLYWFKNKYTNFNNITLKCSTLGRLVLYNCIIPVANLCLFDNYCLEMFAIA